MTRTLRALALVGILGLGICLLGFVVYRASALPIMGRGRGAALGTVLLLALVMSVASWLGTSVASIAGVVAAVASVQRRQRGWAIALVSVLVLRYVSPVLLSYFPVLAWPFVSSFIISAMYGSLLGVVEVAPMALLALVYSFLPTPTARPASETTGGAAGE